MENSNSIYKVEKFADFDADHTFDCGQCFRWDREEDGSYTGVAFGRTVNIKKENGGLVIDNCTEEDYKTAFDLRLMLEPYALRQSIDLISDEEIAAMEEKLQQDYEQVHSVPDFYACDNEFHHMLYQHTNSKLLISTLDNVRAYTMRYYGRRFDVVLDAKKKLYQDSLFDPKRTIRDEIKEHMVILETVKKRDGDLAAALLKEHISFTASEVDAQAELTQAQNTVIPRKSTQVI